MSLKDTLAGLTLVGFFGTICGVQLYDVCINRPKREKAELINNGIIHEYLDTNNNGSYDFYRYTQKGPRVRTYYYIGDNFVTSREQDFSRTFSGSLFCEMSKEECVKEERIGEINFSILVARK